MLKSKLDISQEIKLLDNQLNSYCISILNPTYSVNNKASGDYYALFKQLNNSLKDDHVQFRKRFIDHLENEKNFGYYYFYFNKK